MSIYDFHRRVLCPDIWSADELHLRRRTVQQLQQQLRSRFPDYTRVFMLGDLVGHYYDEASTLDLLLLVPKELVSSYRKEAELISGYNLKGTSHPVHFYVLDDSVRPELVADKFGTLFDLISYEWVGRRDSGLTELANSKALIQYIKWRLYKAKDWDDLYPYEWNVLPHALEYLNDAQLAEVLQELVESRARLRNNVVEVLERYPDANIWKAADKLENLLENDADEDDIESFVVSGNIPKPVLLALYNAYRYSDVIDTVEEYIEKFRKSQKDSWDQEGIRLQFTASTEKTAGTGAEEYMKHRLLHLVDQIIMANGGHHNAVETIYDLFKMILRRSRYLTMRSQRRNIALRLYKRFNQ